MPDIQRINCQIFVNLSKSEDETHNIKKINFQGNFPGGTVAKNPNARGPGSIPGQATRSHMPQLRPGTAKK